ncbi:MAG TPA: malto-oligosyltrehalose synthase, partial [Pantoea sp.]|nr:malto-oligosyltrehalose synthase [Pantoea sp.]
LDYARRLLSPANTRFLADFSQTLLPFIAAGLINSLSQTVIKLTAPGVPDIYQGSEALNFSLVDPDNRLEPDFDALQQMLGESGDFSAPEGWRSGQLKQQVIATLLPLRQQQHALFRHGDYVPLVVNGTEASHAVAFARADAQSALIVVVPRLAFARPRYSEATFITLKEPLAQRRYRNIFTGEVSDLTDRLSLVALNSGAPLVLISV